MSDWAVSVAQGRLSTIRQLGSVLREKGGKKLASLAAMQQFLSQHEPHSRREGP